MISFPHFQHELSVSVSLPSWSASYPCGKQSENGISFKRVWIARILKLNHDMNNMGSWSLTLTMYDEVISSKLLEYSNVKNIWLTYTCIWFKLGSLGPLGRHIYTLFGGFHAVESLDIKSRERLWLLASRSLQFPFCFNIFSKQTYYSISQSCRYEGPKRCTTNRQAATANQCHVKTSWKLYHSLFTK